MMLPPQIKSFMGKKNIVSMVMVTISINERVLPI